MDNSGAWDDAGLDDSGLDPDSLSRNHATGKDYLGRPLEVIES